MSGEEIIELLDFCHGYVVDFEWLYELYFVLNFHYHSNISVEDYFIDTKKWMSEAFCLNTKRENREITGISSLQKWRLVFRVVYLTIISLITKKSSHNSSDLRSQRLEMLYGPNIKFSNADFC